MRMLPPCGNGVADTLHKHPLKVNNKNTNTPFNMKTPDQLAAAAWHSLRNLLRLAKEAVAVVFDFLFVCMAALEDDEEPED